MHSAMGSSSEKSGAEAREGREGEEGRDGDEGTEDDEEESSISLGLVVSASPVLGREWALDFGAASEAAA